MLLFNPCQIHTHAAEGVYVYTQLDCYNRYSVAVDVFVAHLVMCFTCTGDRREKARLQFRIQDSDGNGMLSRDELIRLSTYTVASMR